MWRELVGGLTSDATFAEPASDVAVRAAEQALSQPLPAALVALLRETNGVWGRDGLGLVWSVERIAGDNQRLRGSPDLVALYMPFDPLLFFADAGNGDQFALLAPPVDRDDVFVWDHETDSRNWIAGDLETYLRWWIGGQIKL